MTTAIVFVLSEYLLPDASIGINHCIAHGYDAKLVKDDWKTAMEYLTEGVADVLVVADEGHLDPDRTPRIEVVSRQPSNDGPGGKRIEIIRRGEEA